jgi:glycosyltransferase involved in cell wall biosynthesis
LGEFGVCKNVFVATDSGCFSERSAAYLASGRPVVMQDTGFSQHIPCGRGLFAVRDVDEAAAAIEEINRDYSRHSQWARELAMEYLDASKVLGKFLSELGV